MYVPDDREDYYLGIPAHLNYIFLGKGGSKLELGFGASFFVPNLPIGKDRKMFPSGAIMYRRQAADNGYLFRIGISPVFMPDQAVNGESDALLAPIFWFWPSVSFGYKL